MGYYKDYLQSYYDNYNCEEITIQERMMKIKKSEEERLQAKHLSLKTVYNDYLFLQGVNHKTIEGHYGFFEIKNNCERVAKELKEIEGKNVVDYFKDLIEKEEQSLIKYEENAFTTMGRCVEKMASVDKGINKIINSFGGKEEKLDYYKDCFDKANYQADVACVAEDEWESLNNFEKTAALIARYETTGSIKFSSSDLDKYAEDQAKLNQETKLDEEEEQ